MIYIIFYKQNNSIMSFEFLNQAFQEFRINIIGSAGVGKTTFIKRHITGEFIREYNPTSCIDSSTIELETNMGLIRFHINEIGGQKLFNSSIKNTNGVIAMFDLTSSISMKNCIELIKNFDECVGQQLPLVVCGNKCDINGVKQKKFDNTSFRETNENNEAKYLLSVKSMYNFEKPLIYLAKKLTNNDDLQIVSKPKTSKNEREKTPEIKRNILTNQYQQYIDNVESMFATGNCSIEKIKSFINKNNNLIDDIVDLNENDDYKINSLENINLQLHGAMKLLHGQQYKLLLDDINE